MLRMNPSPIRLRPPNPESGTYDSLLLRICPSKARAPESCSLGFKSGQIGIRVSLTRPNPDSCRALIAIFFRNHKYAQKL